MIRGKFLLAVALLCLTSASFAAGDSRGVAVAALSTEALAEAGFSPDESAGLFVGVRQFLEDGKPSTRISEIPFAVDDAVDLAHLFVFDLKLIKPAKVTLALAGNPEKEETRAKLKALADAGATRTNAQFTTLLRQITKAKNAAGARGILVVSFATHGYAQNGERLLGEDSLLSDLELTGLPVARILDDVAASKAPRRIVLLDACREKVAPGRGIGDPAAAMGRGFSDAIAKAEGMAVISSTTLGGFSYDDPALGNGVFTSQVLAGLKGAAPCDDRGYITPHTLAAFVDERVKSWVKENRPEHAGLSKGITINVDVGAGSLPLAMNQGAREKQKEEVARRQRLLNVLKQNMDFKHITGAMVDEIGKSDHSGADADGLWKRLERLEREGAEYAEDFALWWKQSGRGLLAMKEKPEKLKKPKGKLPDPADIVGEKPVTGRAKESPLVKQAIDFYIGTGGRVDHAQARELLQKAEAAGDPVAKLWIARFHFIGRLGFERDEDKGRKVARSILPEIRERAEKGDADALFLLGSCYAEGMGVEVDAAQAVTYYRAASEKGSVAAMSNLGYHHEIGSGVTKDAKKAAAFYQQAADLGSTLGMRGMAYLHMRGDGVARSGTKAESWYRKAADRGSPEAMHDLAYEYSLGMNLPRDDAASIEWYKKAIAKGYAPSMSNMGWMYEVGRGVERDFGQAAAWYRKGADGGDRYGMSSLGQLYLYGRGVAQNDAQAAAWFRKAAEAGDVTGMVQLGWMREVGRGGAKDYDEALRLYGQAVELKSGAAMEKLGWMYLNGVGVSRDDAMALSWFHRGADVGHAGSMRSLGWAYDQGRGVAASAEKALQWYIKAAELGDGYAMNNIGILYNSGRGVPKDSAKALEWFRLGIEMNCPLAMTNLGYMYHNGIGVARDLQQALVWYQKGAEGGDPLGMNNLGAMYENGFAVARDLTIARQWYEKAAALGNTLAQQNLARLSSGNTGTNQNQAQVENFFDLFKY